MLKIGFDLTVDRLTAVMLLVVTGVGLLIHLPIRSATWSTRKAMAIFRLPEPVHVLHAVVGAGLELAFVLWVGKALGCAVICWWASISKRSLRAMPPTKLSS
jgi:hypothetical protein